MLRKIILLLAVLVLGFNSNSIAAPTLVISDIDDTLKAANVRSLFGVIENVGHIHSSFAGMPRLYRALVDQPEFVLRYVSNAEKFLMYGLHYWFLSANEFPQEHISFKNHNGGKPVVIQRLIEHFKPSLVIMIGDNGEKDPESYEIVAKHFENSAIKFETYVHHVYDGGSLVKPNQIAYLTSIEIGWDLVEKRVLSNEVFESILPGSVDDLRENPYGYNAGPVTFPSFQSCKTFTIPDFLKKSQNEHLVGVRDLITQKCQ